MARHTKLTPELTDKICELLEVGMPYHLVCDAVGISESTFYDWINKGNEDNSKKMFSEFSKRVAQSKAKVVEQYLKRLEGYSKDGSVYATTWFLERRCPEDFGRRDKLDLDNKHSGKVEVVLTVEDFGEDSET
jgi:transposase